MYKKNNVTRSGAHKQAFELGCQNTKGEKVTKYGKLAFRHY